MTLTKESSFADYRQAINDILSNAVNFTVSQTDPTESQNTTAGFNPGHFYINNDNESIWVLLNDSEVAIWLKIFSSNESFITELGGLSATTITDLINSRVDSANFNSAEVINLIRISGLEISDINGLQEELDDILNSSDFNSQAVYDLLIIHGLEISDINGLQEELDAKVDITDFTPTEVRDRINLAGLSILDIINLQTELNNRVNVSDFTSNEVKNLLLQEGLNVSDITGLQTALDNAGSVRLEDFDAQLTTNGYQMLPSGLIIQWYRRRDGLPIPFPNDEFVTLHSNGNTSSSDILPSISIGN